MDHSRARRHDLNLPFSDHSTMAHVISVPKFPFQRNTDDFHIIMRMLAKTRTALNRIVIEYAEHPEVIPIGMIIFGETKSVIAFEPSMIGMTSAIDGYIDRYHGLIQ